MGAVYSLCLQLSCGLCLGDKKRAHVASSSWPARVRWCPSSFCFNERRKRAAAAAAAVFLSGPSLMHREQGTRTWQRLPLIKRDCCLIANSDSHSPNKITFVIWRWMKWWVYERKSLACWLAGQPFVRLRASMLIICDWLTLTLYFYLHQGYVSPSVSVSLCVIDSRIMKEENGIVLHENVSQSCVLIQFGFS